MYFKPIKPINTVSKQKMQSKITVLLTKNNYSIYYIKLIIVH